jgi:hypothetical protein
MGRKKIKKRKTTTSKPRIHIGQLAFHIIRGDIVLPDRPEEGRTLASEMNNCIHNPIESGECTKNLMKEAEWIACTAPYRHFVDQTLACVEVDANFRPQEPEAISRGILKKWGAPTQDGFSSWERTSNFYALGWTMAARGLFFRSPDEIKHETVNPKAVRYKNYAHGLASFYYTHASVIAGHGRYFRLEPLLAEAFLNTDVLIPYDEIKAPFPFMIIEMPPALAKDHGFGPSHIAIFSGTSKAKNSGKQDWGLASITASGHYSLCVLDIDYLLSTPGTPSEQKKTKRFLNMAANLMLYCTNCGDDIMALNPKLRDEANRRLNLRGLKRKKKGKGKPTSTNNTIYIVGRKFEREASQTGGEVKMRARHMVRGHWRNQPYGPGRAYIKQIWIKPHLSGGNPTVKDPQPIQQKDYHVII